MKFNAKSMSRTPGSVDLESIRSLTDFQRNAKALLRDMRRSGRAMVLTVNGKAAAVVQDPGAYQRLLDQIDRAETIIALQRGLSESRQGKVEPADEVFDRIRKKHGLQRSIRRAG